MNTRTRHPITGLILLLVGSYLAIPFVATAEPGPTLLRQKDVPIIITSPGSYRLVTNLTVADPNVTAITVGSDDVTIDLNGFTIEGPRLGPVGAGSGVNVNQARHNILVRNGVVVGFYDAAAACVHLPGGNNRVENLRVNECPQAAIAVGPAGVVRDCQVLSSVRGIGVGTGGMIIGNTVVNSASFAFGLFGQGGVSIVGNSCQGAGDACVLIRADGNRIEGNTFTGSTVGLDLSGGTGNFYARNFLHGNGTAVLAGAGNVDGGAIDPALSNVIVP